jgi:hypothetical protein
MCSFSRNSSRLKRALLYIPALLLLGSTAHAATDSHFVLTAYTNAQGGEELVKGDYVAALVKLGQPGHPKDPSTFSANRCVALIVTQQWEAARKACDTAVHDAQAQRVAHGAWAIAEGHLQDDYLALAYANRAVLMWLSDDTTSAAKDLESAKTLSPRAEFVARNVTALSSHSSVAQLTIAPQR